MVGVTHPMAISVCIATYRRLERLAAVLDDLSRQTQLPMEIVVVDNDADGSAAAVVEAHRRTSPPFALHYAVQPLKNIALKRNRTVEMAAGEWVAFIDDYEPAPPDWLAGLEAQANAYAATALTGPVDTAVSTDAWPLLLIVQHNISTTFS